jgi:hypothetical protein
MKHIGPVVMADRIESLALLEQPVRVELGVEDPLLVVHRTGEIVAVRSEDGAAAAADHIDALELAAEGEVVRVGARTLEVTRADDEGARLTGDVDERRLPSLAVVGGRREVDLHARVVQGEARERHVVLPADQAADACDLRVDRVQAVTVSLTPDQAFVIRRDELAVLEQKPSVCTVDEQRVVERPRPVRLDLRYTRREHDYVLARNVADPVGFWARDGDGLARDRREGCLRARRGPARQSLDPNRRGVYGYERLGKGDERRSVPSGFGGQAAQFLERRVPVEHNRLSLDTGRGDRGPQVTRARAA